MSESSNSIITGQQNGKSKSDKQKKGKADKAQTEHIEALQKVVSGVNERLDEWIDSSGLPDVEALTELLRHVGYFLRATTTVERTSDKHSTFDLTLSDYLKKHGKQISIPSPSPSDSSVQIDVVEATPDGHQTSLVTLSAATISLEKTTQEHTSSRSTPSPNESSKTAQTSKPPFDLTAAISELKQSQQKLAENEKKATRGLETLRESAEKNGEILGQMRSTLNRLPTTDALNSGVSVVLEAVQRLRVDLQAIQLQVEGAQAGALRNDQLLHAMNSGVDEIRATINGKIDLSDAHKVLEYRSMMESHIQASVIDHLSKQILLPLEALKHAVAGQAGDIADTVALLEDRCKKAGLSID